MSDFVGNPEDRFSHNKAHMVLDWRPRMVYKIIENVDYSLTPTQQFYYHFFQSLKVTSTYKVADISNITGLKR